MTTTALLIGGNSSLARGLCVEFKKRETFLTLTHRNKISGEVNLGATLIMNLESKDSIEEFLKTVANKKFSYIINLIGATSSINELPNYEKMQNYFETYTNNLIFLFDNLFLNSILDKNGRILHVSSRAAKYGSFDRFYAASKSAIEGYIRSIPKSLDTSICINAVSVGLITDSKMFSLMKPELRMTHLRRSGNSLFSNHQFAASIMTILEDLNLKSGEIIEIGPQYE